MTPEQQQRRAEIIASLSGTNVEREGWLIDRVLELEDALNEIHKWLVCSAIATPDDMAQSFDYMETLCRLHITPQPERQAGEQEER